MIYTDFMITNFLMNNLNKINSGNLYFDIIFINIITLFLIYINNYNISFVSNYFDNFIDYFNKTNKIVFTATEKTQSKKFRAIMHYVSKNNSNIKSIIEICKWDIYTYKEEYSFYRVEQFNKFEIYNNIYGKIYKKNKYDEKNKEQIEYIYFEISSKKYNINELQNWIDDKLNEYNFYLIHKNNKQQLIDISYYNKELKIISNNWNSNTTFDNRFFTNKDKIIDNINFFINNELWYKEKGIPYTLGFLLYGNPGCGKTSFIKSIINLTGFNAIVIKLCDNFDFTKLKDIIYKDELTQDIIIPTNKRIIVFEDIDCMTDIIIDRDIDNKSKSKIKSNYNNNLSYLLNILDGLNETNGRIIIMTTNKPEVLDKALIRPGRIDNIINFTNATIDDITNTLKHFYNEKIINEIDNNVNLKYKHAEIVNICKNTNNINDAIIKINSK